MPFPLGTAPPCGWPGRRLALAIVLVVAGTPGGCQRPPPPAAAQGPEPPLPPAVATRGPDDAAVTTADVTRSPAATPTAGRPLPHWRGELASHGEATLLLQAVPGARELPPDAAAPLDALAQLLAAERGWRLAVSIDEATSDAELADGEGVPYGGLQWAQAFRLALLARGVAAERIRAEPPTPGGEPPPPGMLRVHLRRLPSARRP